MATYSTVPAKADPSLPGVDPTVNDGGLQYATQPPIAYGSPPTTSFSTNNGPAGERQFAISCFEIGDLGTCLLSYILSPYAMAYGRSYLDGSDMCVTCYNMNPIILRWITRSAYNIPGSAWEDCFLGMFCPCCVINQVAQTAQRYGRPNAFAGPENNNTFFTAQGGNDCCANCCYATFCLPCAIGTSLEHSMGMPFCMGCMFANFCISRNLLRYHYRIKGSDCMEDCLFPYGICFLATVCSSYIPCVYCMTCPYFVAMIMGLLHESKVRGNPAPNAPNGSYLHPPTYVPPQGQTGVVQIGLPGAQSAVINSNGIQMVQQQQPQYVYNGGVITQVAPVAATVNYAQPANPYTQPHPVYVQIQQQQQLQQQQQQQMQQQQMQYVSGAAQQPYAPITYPVTTAPNALVESNQDYPTVTAKAL